MIALLIESALRAGLLAAIVWLATTTLRMRNPRLQRSAWLVVLSAALAMPALMSLTALSPPAALSAVIQPIALPDRAAFASSVDWYGVLPWIYAAIAGLLIVRHAVAVTRLWRIRNAAERLPYSSSRAVDVRISKVIESPVTVFSTVLVPAGFDSWSMQKQAAVIAHESEHIANHDFYVQSLAHFHRSVFWFNPLAWWLPKRLSLLSEHLSDDAAIVAVDDRTAYAEILLGLASNRAPIAAAISMASPRTLSTRLDRILTETAVPGRSNPLRRYGLVVALLPLIGGVAGLQAAAQTQPQSAPTAAQKTAPTESSGIVLPRSNPTLPLSQPVYPPPSRLRGEHGTVVLRLHVLKDGTVGDAAIEESSGYPSLDNAALYEAYRWNLIPGTHHGKLEAMWGKFAVTFKTKEQELR